MLRPMRIARPAADPGPEPAAIPPEEAARLLGLALPSLRRLCEAGALPPVALRSRAALFAWRDGQALRQQAALAALAALSEAHDL